MRMEDLHHAGHGAPDGLAVARVEMRTEREVVVDDFGEVVLPQFAQGLGQVVDDESVVVREVLVPHLRALPSRQVEMQPVDEGHVVADDVRHGREQMPGLDHHVDGLLGVAEHGDRLAYPAIASWPRWNCPDSQ